MPFVKGAVQDCRAASHLSSQTIVTPETTVDSVGACLVVHYTASRHKVYHLMKLFSAMFHSIAPRVCQILHG